MQSTRDAECESRKLLHLDAEWQFEALFSLMPWHLPMKLFTSLA